MKENQFFRQGTRGCFISLVSILLAIFAMAISANYQYSEHPSCRGMLGAGFPVLFICDDWGGSSPTGSWGKIDFIDVLNGGIRPEGFLIDFLFYSVLIWIVGFITSGVFNKGIKRHDLWWATFISVGFIFGFLFAFLMFQSSRLYIGGSRFRATSTPISLSPTPLETMPSIITPITTSTP
jgi:hypothetical protein